jgi:hypothetical protein
VKPESPFASPPAVNLNLGVSTLLAAYHRLEMHSHPFLPHRSRLFAPDAGGGRWSLAYREPSPQPRQGTARTDLSRTIAIMAAVLLTPNAPAPPIGSILFRPVSPVRDGLSARRMAARFLITDGKMDARRSPVIGPCCPATGQRRRRRFLSGVSVGHFITPYGPGGCSEVAARALDTRMTLSSSSAHCYRTPQSAAKISATDRFVAITHAQILRCSAGALSH